MATMLNKSITRRTNRTVPSKITHGKPRHLDVTMDRGDILTIRHVGGRESTVTIDLISLYREHLYRKARAGS